MKSELEIKEEMCEIGRRVYNRGMVAANDGNFSVKLNDNEFLCTPTGVSKGFMTPEFICKVNAKGEVLEANEGFRPSSEVKMHMRIYAKRPDVNAVVHAHPMYATSFAIAGKPLMDPIMPEAVISLGGVPLAKYGTPGTMEVPDSIEGFLDDYDAVLLENHGALTYSDSLMNAYYKMESVEFYARLMYQAQMLGGAQIIPPEKAGEFFGLLDICGKGASFMGTGLVSVVTQATGHMQLGVAMISVLIIAGYFVFRKAAKLNADLEK